MQQYNNLLQKVSQQYHIYKGNRESEKEWKTRLVYSICGMMAYASLWDGSEEPVSIVHLKNRIRSIFADYKSMYPELSEYLPSDSKELEEEIVNQFTNAGVIYHCPQRIAPSMEREELFHGILFQRGIALDNISFVSGSGFYSKRDGMTNSDTIKAMFGLEQKKLRELWQTLISAASWKACPQFGYITEYLRLSPSFSHGYWVDKPDTDGSISILRTGIKGSQLYYLYRCTGTGMEISPLPQWQVENNNYIALACACLSLHGTLPPIEYSEDGALVYVYMNYLLPPRELGFLKLYSWPASGSDLPCDFRRILSIEVFEAIKKILSDEGYVFREEKFNAKRG